VLKTGGKMPRVLTIFFSGHQFSWQLQSFVCLGTFSGQAQCFEDMEVKNCKSHWNYEVEVLLHNLKFEGCLADKIRVQAFDCQV
jgi:hypothetical protein